MKKTIIPVLLSAAMSLSAQNPVIRNQFAADPTARVFNGRVYLYPSHDIVPPADFQRKDWFCMADYHVFSSSDLIDWTDHGVIVSQQNVPWGKADAYSMWAPDCVEKGGRYFFYFPNAPRSGRGFAIGVATADRPEGPFTPETDPIPGVTGIDPCVLVDNDGQAYIYWSGMGIRGARLKDNMKELADPLETISMRQGGSMQVGGKQMEGLPEGFKEGPFVFRRADWYYLTFPWVRGSKENGANPTETLAYAMSRSPLGPWTFKGIIMAEHANGCWTNHHSIVEYKNQWYLFYHRNDFSPNDDKRRSVRIDRISFREDGTIEEVYPTNRGVGINLADSKIDVDRYSSAEGSVSTAFVDSLRPFKGWYASLSGKGSRLHYADVDFSSLRQGAYVVAQVRAKADSEVKIAIGKKVLARIPVKVITQRGQFRRDQSGQWLTLTAPLDFLPKDVSTITLSTEGEAVDVDWIQFRSRPDYFREVAVRSEPLVLDSTGFIRCWSLLEPKDYEVRSNIILSDSYLKDMVSRELPQVNPKKGKWHLLESQTYNVRLFRFAEQVGANPYNSLFWGETVVFCPKELVGVRLAAGSNGASCWWLNDEPVLTLDGDRRMVEDDGVSQRLTLKEGSNVLRFCLVNGPGLSDLCVRFIRENGRPVTDFSIK